MACANPYMVGLIPAGCTKCLPCRIQKRKEWSDRITLERQSHSCASFVTLTYRDEELHDAFADWDASRPLVPNLEPKHLQQWLKRIRRSVGSSNGLRFYAVGEYGSETGRPHYHIALFGFPPCSNVGSRCGPMYKDRISSYCDPCKMVAQTWGKGNIDVGELNEQSASYVAGYVTKKFTEDSKWQKQGRTAPFQRMSLKPGIGAIATKSLATFGVQNRTARQRILSTLIKSIDAPVVLRSGGSTLRLGRYLRRKWREALGRDPDTPQSEIDRYVQELYQEAQTEKLSGRELHFKKNAQKIKIIDKRFKIYNTGGKI